MDELRLKALELAKGKPASPKELSRAANATSAEAAAWAFGQWELRTRAQAKFKRASEMFFVREALEQATHEAVASYHSGLFPVGAQVADLTVGIGADTLALARRGPVVGFELDPERANLAQLNLKAFGLQADLHVEDCFAGDWSAYYAFADPARRVESRRTLSPEEFSPNPVDLAARMQGLKLGAIKLSPLLQDEFLQSLGPRLEFVSYDRECREALVMLGSEAIPGRFAVHVESGQVLEDSFSPVEVREPGAYLFDADPAAVRAHALGSLCDHFGLVPLGTSAGYLTGDQPVSSPWLRTYRVLYSGKADTKATRRALASLDARVIEVKQRGAKLNAEKVRKEFSAQGDQGVSLILWMDGASVRHTLAIRE